MNPESVAWLAGLLEGEGCFILVWKGDVKRYPSAVVTCASTDMDVLMKARSITGGFGNIRPLKKYQDHHKQAWRWQVVRRNEIVLLLTFILPHMMSRRSERIAEILQAFASHPPRPLPRHGTRQMYEKRGCRCRDCKDSNNKRHRDRRRARKLMELPTIFDHEAA